MAFPKFIVSFLLVAVYLSQQVDSAALKNDVDPIARYSLVLGMIQPNDLLLFNQLVVKPAIPGEIVSEDVYFGGFGFHLNYITAFEVQGSEGGSAVLIGGGLGEDNAAIRLSSAVGGELKYLVNMYGQ